MVPSRAASWGSDRTDHLPRGYRIGDWVVTEPIGAGGWATVYAGRPSHDHPDGPHSPDGAGRAEDEAVATTGRAAVDRPPVRGEVALKIMPTAGLAPRQARQVAEAARREVEIGRRAEHPRLVRLLDHVVLAAPEHPSLDGAIVLVMERGRCTLRDLLDALVTEAEGGRLIAGICEGLAHLHRAGWVHADLKPENVLIGEDGSVKLADFGLATELTGTHGHAPPMGTPDYLPPERWKAPLGDLGVQIRPSADVWALGILIHEVFASGSSPFPGATPLARGAAVQEYAEGRAPLRMDNAVPEFWRALAADCLAPTHAARAAHTADSLLARISAQQSGRPGRASGSGSSRLRRWIRAAVLVVTVFGAVGAAIWSSAGREGSPGSPGGAGQPPLQIRVFNAQRGCQNRTDRDPQCSLGLAIDPLRSYTAENVVPTRVWHGDVLDAYCQLPDGEPITDEEDLQSALWFRVRLPRAGVRATAWLPAVRTKGRPALPRCPHPTPTR
ncbi:serine/threonine protein kinase [Streptomyces sp. NBC_01022]|nr:serine/threonine-protein kinase [Streptomyces sp. NBC_01022]WRZ87008.1 serine/threonine protein kinase [Streptomyces sp. NBC_01022]